jgi:hypothetical protein
LKHYASRRFRSLYQDLPTEVREVADKNYKLLKSNPRHPSLHLKRIGKLWAVRVGEHYRALGVDVEGGISWIWIGTHAEYDEILS